AVHVANSATRGSLMAGSVGLNSVAVGVGGVDGLVAAAGLARQLHSKSLREVLHDPVTETLASIGAAGVGNALRIAGLPILAEASFSGGALLGTHSIKSAVDEAIRARHGPHTKGLKSRMATAWRVLRHPDFGLATANAFMKLSLVAL